MFIGSNIKFLRFQTRLEQSTFGELFNLSRSNIDSYERGNAQPKLESLKKICDHFNLTFEEILFIDFNVNPEVVTNKRMKDKLKSATDEIIKSKNETIKEQRRHIEFLNEQIKALIEKLDKKSA